MATTKTATTMKHAVIDDDKTFHINIANRTITHESDGKLLLVQGDSNSERYTFEIPRVIEGHKVDECTEIEVHYINIGSDATNTSSGIYIVDDMKVSDDEQSVGFSWLISHGATSLVGTLNFVVKCICRSTRTIIDEITGEPRTESVIDYLWSTLPYTGITISSGIDSGGTITTEYTDILNTWYDAIIVANDSAKNTAIAAINTTAQQAQNEISNVVNTTMENLKDDVLDHSYNFAKTIVAIDGDLLHFFVGTEAEYEALSDDDKLNTFAIITDDKSAEEVAVLLEQLKTKLLNGDISVYKAVNAGRAAGADSADCATAVAEINGNNSVKFFLGTKQEYDAVSDKTNTYLLRTDVPDDLTLFEYRVVLKINKLTDSSTAMNYGDRLVLYAKFTETSDALTDSDIYGIVADTNDNELIDISGYYVYDDNYYPLYSYKSKKDTYTSKYQATIKCISNIGAANGITINSITGIASGGDIKRQYYSPPSGAAEYEIEKTIRKIYPTT